MDANDGDRDCGCGAWQMDANDEAMERCAPEGGGGGRNRIGIGNMVSIQFVFDFKA